MQKNLHWGAVTALLLVDKTTLKLGCKCGDLYLFRLLYGGLNLLHEKLRMFGTPQRIMSTRNSRTCQLLANSYS